MPARSEGHAASSQHDANPADAREQAAAEISRQVEAERIGSLQALIPPTLAGGSVFACVAAALLLPVAPPAWVLAWLTLRLLVAAVRGWEVHRFRRASATERARPAWRLRLFAGLWVDGAIWSALPLLFLPYTDATGSGFLLAAAVGVAAVGAFSLSANEWASAGFLALMLGPLAAQQVALGTRLSMASGGCLALYAVVVLVECRRGHRRFSETARLRFENAHIAEQRQRALIYAEHSNAAKTRFLASVSHELRTPLNGILGMTQLMADDPLTPMQQRSLVVVQQSAEHLVSVIGDLLDLSRIDMDRVALEPRPAYVAQTLRDVVDLLKPVAMERGLRFLAAVHPSLPQVAVYDAARVKQVLHNLVGNAIKYTPAGEIRVIARLADAQTLSFEVRDTGEGVPPDASERIFEPFEQASSAVGSRGGAGLGLTLSRQIARAMGGDVIHKPAPGGGARFVFTLAYTATDERPPATRTVSRALKARAPAAAPSPSPASSPAPGSASSPSTATARAVLPPDDFADTEPETIRRPARPDGPAPTPAPAPRLAGATRRDSGVEGRVLIVEDNEVNALVVRGMLDWLGVASDRVTDGRQALDCLRAQGSGDAHPSYDLVLMDCQMPLLDGWSATREWRRMERARARPLPGQGRAGAPARRLPIIALTASAAAGERERCLAAGMDDYLSKPFTREQLLAAIRPWLARAPR